MATYVVIEKTHHFIKRYTIYRCSFGKYVYPKMTYKQGNMGR